ncbi:hypothetical protein ACEPAF_4115 [Sanghuangporus sanghuang]
MKPVFPVAIPRLVSKFVATYDRLFAGFAPEQIAPYETASQFWANLFSLQVDTAHLSGKIRRLRKEETLRSHKSLLNTLCATCISQIRSAARTDVRAEHAAETLSIVVRCVMEKGLDGWEVMEVLAGGVGRSDEAFLGLVNAIEEVLLDETAPPTLKHAVLRLTLVFASSVGQLSPGAYLLRRNLFPALTGIAKTPETQEYTFEAVVLLSILAGFHRTDSPRLNGYLREIEKTEDREFLRAFVYAANYKMDSVIKAYQEILDDSPPTFASSVSSLFASFRPDRALSATPVDTPKERFKNQPIEATVTLLPVHDFLPHNTVFNVILLEPFISPLTSSASAQLVTNGKSKTRPSASSTSLPPLICTFLTLCSYIFSHATSVQSPRAAAYANLCLATLLHLVENDVAMSALIMPTPSGSDIKVRICRQRLPALPTGPSTRPVLCAVLDCCVLWLRHNLHRRLEMQSYMTCIWIIYHTIWFLSKTRRRLEYHWEELWRSLILLLDFLSAKMSESLKVEQLVQETVILLDFSLSHAESFLGSPQAVHQLVYELVRSTVTLHKQHPLCQKKQTKKRPGGQITTNPSVALRRLLDAAVHYEQVIRDSGAKSSSANSVLRAIAREIERDGVLGAREMNDDEAPKRSDELGEIGFIRYACFIRYAYEDVLTLMT